MIVQVDKLGRIVLKKKLREKYGKQFILIDKGDEIILKPTYEDPFYGIEELGKKLEKYSLKELSEMGEEQAKKEVEEKLKRL
ncbi:AbrB family transcriptional regulator [Candidatus Pacearchaeota archaeon]|nr:AbrB family transcriptional regulator [Candidatus Pacearchaeota archaeon]